MKNIVICAALNDESLNLLRTLKDSPLLNQAKIHCVHCFKTEVYTNEFSAYVFPSDDKFPEIEKAVVSILSSLQKDVLGVGASAGDIHCFFDHSPKQKIREYLKDIKADLVIVATRGKHGLEGLFSSSFAEHLIKYSPCDIHVLRPVKS